MKHTVKIRENYLFRRLYRIGKSNVTPYFAVYAKKNRLGSNRLGITATKKIGCAVERNRARRVITEAYRLLEDKLPKGFDYVIAARRKAVLVKMQVVKASLAKVYGIVDEQ
jgi:ribonuclease P protein component